MSLSKVLCTTLVTVKAQPCFFFLICNYQYFVQKEDMKWDSLAYHYSDVPYVSTLYQSSGWNYLSLSIQNLVLPLRIRPTGIVINNSHIIPFCGHRGWHVHQMVVLMANGWSLIHLRGSAISSTFVSSKLCNWWELVTLGRWIGHSLCHQKVPTSFLK